MSFQLSAFSFQLGGDRELVAERRELKSRELRND